MKKILSLFIILGILFLASCNSKTESVTTEETTTTEDSTVDNASSDDDDVLTGINEFELDYDSFKSQYGDFSLTLDDEVIEPVDGIYTINVTSSKQELVATGYLEGRIVIQNGNSLSSYKGVTLYLNNAFIVNDDATTIDYGLSDKNIEIVNSKETTNYIVNTSETNYNGHGIYSNNNIEMRIQTSSNLYLYTAHGHTIKADGDVKIIGPGNISLSSGHDAVHCHNFTTNNSGSFSGTFTITNSVSQAIEASDSNGEGTVNITNGTFVINDAESVFKVDYAINITGGSVTATGIWASPFVRGASRVLYLNISDGITVSVNGSSFLTQEI